MCGDIVRKEIGSEFWSIPVKDAADSLFAAVNGIKWFISGTSALEFILQDIISQHPIKTAALPSWCW